MPEKRLNLSDFEVKSFVTGEHMGNLKGGTPPLITFGICNCETEFVMEGT